MVRRLLTWAWRRAIPGLHPGIEDILAWVDGDLALAEHWALEAHLAVCRKCDEDARTLREAQTHLRQIGSEQRNRQAILLNDGLCNLEASMRVWSALRGLPPEIPHRNFLRNSVNLRSTRAVELYFGQEAANRIARSAKLGAHEPHLLPAIKPLFSAFLGRRAAESVARHIVRTV
ncbi:MAG TPA: zf-HC2 domain-containing protein [Bryobacteraceae bacterium]|nr:zf-HC2 domain-containing protein [Bryobacteraceae bacterium]